MQRADITLDRDRLRVSGTIDFVTAPRLWEQSLPLLTQQTNLEFDLSGVVSANSAALAVLLEWLKYAKQTRKQIAFYDLPANLLAVASIAGLKSILVNGAK